ncbi:MAG: MFS transporter [Anaerolineae bacterium]|nr:MFS transporter [Anaerolineae bacterium]
MQNPPASLRGFVVFWFGQVVSLLGSAMTWFALMIWAYQETGQATPLALLGAFSFGATVLFSPFAGALVDRWNRKLVLLLSDTTSGLATFGVLALYLAGQLQIWHLYAIGFLAGTFQAFQYPAYGAAVTMMVPKEQYARAGGMLELAWSASSVLAPLLAGILLGRIGVAGIMAIDLLTFLFAMSTLLFVSVPQPPRSRAGSEAKGSIWQESGYGFRYIWARPSLLALLSIFAIVNLVDYAGFTLFAPLILARTGTDELLLGTVQSVGALGGVIGGALLAMWGGSRRRIHGVLLGWSLSSLGILLMGVGRGLYVWLIASFTYAFFEPFVNGSNQAIWQLKVAPDVQGRVFATRFLISQATMPLAMLFVGPVADHLFEPAMMPGGALAEPFGWLVGSGPGAGMALMCVCAGLAAVLLPLLGYAVPLVRDVERLIPDHDAAVPEPLA